jgi:hemerythrin-like domain-containing protein
MTRNTKADGRRRALQQVAVLGPLLVGGGAVAVAAPSAKKERQGEEDEVSPTEDLMREHGVLRRMLLVYAEASRRLEAGEPIPTEPLAHGARIVRSFIEDYHERDEEEFIFPRFRKAGKLVDLVNVLLQQHQVGRKLTVEILRLATPGGVAAQSGRADLARTMRSFTRMYEAHAAHEDTVLFPAFRELIDEKELEKLMETFEAKEKALPLGDFEKMVSEVARLERAFGIGNLAMFTPRA